MRTAFIDEETGASISVSRCRIGGRNGRTIDKVYCPPAHRGKGIAGRLFRQILAQADREGLMLRLIVSGDDDGGPDDEQLASWYTSLGFERVGFSWYVRVPNGKVETLHASAA
jgi:GNAT superfamily N-acetyltransferase